MKVYKFGGASVKTADGVRNLQLIVEDCIGSLFIIISAMGKTTNALEVVLENFMERRTDKAKESLLIVEQFHRGIISDLFGAGVTIDSVEGVLKSLDDILSTNETIKDMDYDLWYDRVISCGELLSTLIISEYLNSRGVSNRWIDVRECLITDSKHRDANVNMELSEARFKDAIKDTHISIGQGFIGADESGTATTLGREGSDYSAALVANFLDAESISIWKDVEGVLNADPRVFSDAVYIPELTYLDAIELAYSGAQIIHPKSIKPLQNKNIPLYVRPFSDKSKCGSVIKETIKSKIVIPILIVKQNQILLSIRPQDFSFVLEDRLCEVLNMFEEYDIKPNLIQSSAVNLSVSVNMSRLLERLMAKLRVEGFRVVHNEDMEILTIRGYDSAVLERYCLGDDVYLTQKTRRIIRVVRKAVH